MSQRTYQHCQGNVQYITSCGISGYGQAFLCTVNSTIHGRVLIVMLDAFVFRYLNNKYLYLDDKSELIAWLGMTFLAQARIVIAEISFRMF